MRDYIYNKTIKNRVPNKELFETWLDRFYNWLFTNYNYDSFACFLAEEQTLCLELEVVLQRVITKDKAGLKAQLFFNQVETLYKILESDLEGYMSYDKSVQSKSEIIAFNSGFLAMYIYRVSQVFIDLGITVLPQIANRYGYRLTGIDISPFAKIGKQLILINGLGVVIGSTVVIGNNVRIHQGVILGEHRQILDLCLKESIVIEDNVVIRERVSITGNAITIGKGSRIGPNLHIPSSIEANSNVELDNQYRIRINETIIK